MSDPSSGRVPSEPGHSAEPEPVVSALSGECPSRKVVLPWPPIAKRIRRWWQYRKTWRTRVGRDCISLDASLCDWLAERLAFLAHHHHSFPAESSSQEWAIELLAHAMALSVYSERWDAETREAEERLIAAAQESLRWVADHLPGLWD